MEGDVSVELLEEWDPITNQDRQDRIADFVGQPKPKAFEETMPPPTNQMLRNVGRRRPFTNCARSPEWNSTVARVRGSSRLVRTKVGLSP